MRGTAVRRLLEVPAPSAGRRRRGAPGLARPVRGPGASLPERCFLLGAARPPFQRRQLAAGPAGCRDHGGCGAGGAPRTRSPGSEPRSSPSAAQRSGSWDSPQDKQVIVPLLPGEGAVTLGFASQGRKPVLLGMTAVCACSSGRRNVPCSC